MDIHIKKKAFLSLKNFSLFKVRLDNADTEGGLQWMALWRGMVGHVDEAG